MKVQPKPLPDGFLHIRIDADTRRKLKKLAEAERRTLSDMVRQLVARA